MDTQSKPSSKPIVEVPVEEVRPLTYSDTSRVILMRLIQTIMTVMVVSWSVIFITGNSAHMLLSISASAGLLGLCYAYFRSGRFERGLQYLCWGLWVYIAIFGILIAGIRTPVLILMPSLVMIVAWVRGKRSQALMTVLTVIYLAMLSIADYQKWLPEQIQRSTAQIMVVYVSAVLISSVVALMIAENFRRLIAKSMNLSNELRIRIQELKSSDTALRELNEQLEQRVVERTMQWEDANRALHKTVDKLEQTQAELVNSEKLASLGSMVAGISHELNTPIGNVLTLTTSMEHKYEQMLEQIAAGSIKKSTLLEFLQNGYETTSLATRSTKRAVELVSSFKQVAVDQTSEQRRHFILRDVVEDNIATLWPSVKVRRDTLTIDDQVPESISCDSFPGPLGQVLVNLMQNAILHGVQDCDQGQIVITAEQVDGVVTLCVTDNGVGMTPAVLAHVFDPFFTTKLGMGGSGLGLSVSYRIVTSVLGGTISVLSSPGQGARFILTFPRVAPFKL